MSPVPSGGRRFSSSSGRLLRQINDFAAASSGQCRHDVICRVTQKLHFRKKPNGQAA
jgi:hypothetical protein